MIKQIFLPLAAVAIFITLVGIYTQKSLTPVSSQQKTVLLGDKNIQVEIANTESLRKKGLSGRTTLAQDSGMLFVFDSKQVTPVFWMKDMQIPIDIIWISGDKIVKIDKNVAIPASNAKDITLPKYSTGGVDYVLEVNSGFSDQNKIKVGDSVDLSKI